MCTGEGGPFQAPSPGPPWVLFPGCCKAALWLQRDEVGGWAVEQGQQPSPQKEEDMSHAVCGAVSIRTMQTTTTRSLLGREFPAPAPIFVLLSAGSCPPLWSQFTHSILQDTTQPAAQAGFPPSGFHGPISFFPSTLLCQKHDGLLPVCPHDGFQRDGSTSPFLPSVEELECPKHGQRKM